MGHGILTSSFLNLRSKLHHIALNYLSNDEDAKDALQDTWLKLKSKDNISDANEAKNKLVCALRNVCIDKLRKAKMQSIEDSRTSIPLYYTMETEDIKNLENLLSKGLSPLQQQIFNLVTHEGYDYEQIAEELSMSVEAVRMTMSRTRKKVRENYKKLNE